MGAGTSPADPAPAGRVPDGPDPATESGSTEPGSAGAGDNSTAPERAEAGRGSTGPERTETGGGSTAAAGTGAGDSSTAPERAETGGGSTAPAGAGDNLTEPERAEQGSGSTAAEAGGEPAPAARRSRRFPLFTRDTARPEGGGRAASGDAPAPARQWPLLTVLCTAGVGLLIVALDPFAEAFRIGTILIGAALIAGAVLRWVVPSVGMLAVRSRFTDLVTYGLMGTLIVLLALVAQPRPWLDVPILEDAVRFTIR
ncbi:MULTISPECIES: DUF3017 domain-containing protein [unclassified Streptomyces]|uniref:DUF3017 domain-containing protein n=1 Tax=unclassified Streptomyces TaxID=2593676 RepID=UPI00081E77CD|nr:MULTISPECIES: DUF3017 domain-containing protein [unclassified Streptomyces]MYR95109.1 DUF3017 domain-containing protein [Streptomyces sp. SID4937]SCD84229.1 Protein of unknown function [Streptomyces sp. ScaeMP-e83]